MDATTTRVSVPGPRQVSPPSSAILGSTSMRSRQDENPGRRTLECEGLKRARRRSRHLTRTHEAFSRACSGRRIVAP